MVIQNLVRETPRRTSVSSLVDIVTWFQYYRTWVVLKNRGAVFPRATFLKQLDTDRFKIVQIVFQKRRVKGKQCINKLVLRKQYISQSARIIFYALYTNVGVHKTISLDYRKINSSIRYFGQSEKCNEVCTLIAKNG